METCRVRSNLTHEESGYDETGFYLDENLSS